MKFEDCESDETNIKYMPDGPLLPESLNEGNRVRFSLARRTSGRSAPTYEWGC